MRGVTFECGRVWLLQNISTHTPHARRDLPLAFRVEWNIRISTHTPHARRDCLRSPLAIVLKYFNSHASCEAWPFRNGFSLRALQFQLTRLMRGVTSWQETFFHFYFHFNSHASCEAWPDAPKAVSICTFISTHTPHARRDGKFHGISIAFRCISTHTPHARRDFSALKTDKDKLNFNSHASCEAWRIGHSLRVIIGKFQLTRLMLGEIVNNTWHINRKDFEVKQR